MAEFWDWVTATLLLIGASFALFQRKVKVEWASL
jgi:hypothetical protein